MSENTERKITVSIERTYGNERIVPECETAKLFCKLVRQKTFTKENVDIIKQLGYVIAVKQTLPTTL